MDLVMQSQISYSQYEFHYHSKYHVFMKFSIYGMLLVHVIPDGWVKIIVNHLEVNKNRMPKTTPFRLHGTGRISKANESVRPVTGMQI